MPNCNDQNEAQARIEERERLDLLSVLACPGGRRIIGAIIYNAAIRQSHCPGDALTTAFNEGCRATGLELRARLEMAKPGETAVLLAETLQEIKHAEQAI